MKNRIKRKWLIMLALGTAITPWQALAMENNAASNTRTSVNGLQDGRIEIDSSSPTQVVTNNGRVACQSTSGNCPVYGYAYSENSYSGDGNYYRNTDDRNTGYRMRAESAAN